MTASASDPASDSATAAATAPAALAQQVVARAPSGAARLGLQGCIIIVRALLLDLHWASTQRDIRNLQRQLAERLRSGDAINSEARMLAREAQERVREATTKLALLEAKLTESQSQQAALEQLYQSLARNRDEWALSEIEQVLTVASQQLQLAGNVPGAVIALQNADSRLARGDRAQFIAVRKALQMDLERLKALPYVDVPGMALKLDAMILAVDSLPLIFDERLGAGEALGTPTGEKGGADEKTWLGKLFGETWSEMKQLIRVRDMSGSEPVVLPPTQTFFLRENLKLRLLNARIALMQRNETAFRADLLAAQNWLGKHYDLRAKSTVNAVAVLKGLSASALAIELPTLADSLNAVRNFRAAREVAPGAGSATAPRR